MRFLRYPGGKTKLLDELLPHLQEKKFIRGRYIEPFVGGGSVFFAVNPDNALLSDLNKELIDLYKGIRNYPHKVWEMFAQFPEGKEAYYQVRDTAYQHQKIWYRAARTLFLNRTCFKGMWRHNQEGKFNVGFGGDERRWAITYENILDLSKRFKRASLLFSDFDSVLNEVQVGDFIFIDPPYNLGEKEMDELHYINGKFTFDDQVRLSKRLIEISKTNNINWVMTNSSHPEILNLYKGFEIIPIRKGTGRSPGIRSEINGEVIIKN